MPAPSRRSRTWSTAVALAAVLFAVAVCGPHASVRHLAAGPRTVAADGDTAHLDASRAPELRHPAAPQIAPHDLDLTAPPTLGVEPPATHPALRVVRHFTSTTSAADPAPRGRAPPAA